MPACVKPNPKKLKRPSVNSCPTGFLDYFLLAIDEDFIGYPGLYNSYPSSLYEDYTTATGNFRTSEYLASITPGPIFRPEVWSKIEVKKGSLKLEQKSLALKDTSAVETTVMFELDSSSDTLGFCEMYKRTDVQLILPMANGKFIWVGREYSAAQMAEFGDSQGIEKSSNQVQIKSSPFSFSYLDIGYIG